MLLNSLVILYSVCNKASYLPWLDFLGEGQGP